MLTELWCEGVIVEFLDCLPCGRAIIRKAGKNEIVLANIENGAVYKIARIELDERKGSGDLKFLAESRDFGELRFFDLTDDEQRETNRRYQYIKKLLEVGITRITEKSACEVILSVARERGEKTPHWQTVRGWFKNYVDADGRMSGLAPRHRFKGHREPKIDRNETVDKSV